MAGLIPGILAGHLLAGTEGANCNCLVIIHKFTRRHPPMRLEGCPGSGLVRWRVTYLPESMSLVSIGRGNLNHTDSFTNTHRVPVSFPSAFPSSPLAAVG
ncbi:hypothetical protein BJV77DRAFT_999320 [Russula vinacea]|nr:hypothetical protein BJV77DRAFT_999320 [Russula vinacea]